MDTASITIEGVPVNPTTTYRVTVNSYIASGGNGFSVLTEGTDRTGGMTDLDALIAYFEDVGDVPPGPTDRITRLN